MEQRGGWRDTRKQVVYSDFRAGSACFLRRERERVIDEERMGKRVRGDIKADISYSELELQNLFAE